MVATVRPDVLFVTALVEERNALLGQLENPRQLDAAAGTNAYHEGGISNQSWSGGRVSAIVLCLAGMGRVKAAVQTANAINDLRPAIVLLVGIAGGIQRAVSQLGDVIVGEQIFDYELQKLTDEGDQLRHEAYRGDQVLLTAARATADGWRPGLRLDREVSVSFGPIASGDKVIASAPRLDALLRQWPKLLGVEMEAGGVAAAAWFAPSRPRFLMVRGVSDFADAEKNTTDVEAYRPTACASAALFAAELVQRLPALDIGSADDPPLHGDAEKQQLLDRLDTLKQQLLLAKVSGSDTEDLQARILEARRALRSGPSLGVGDHLGSGRYELLEELGSGGFATVWKCADRRSFDVVAIKILHGQWSGDATRVQRFRRGASQMQRLAHPNIVRVIEQAKEEDGIYYFVMELLDGGTFETAIVDRVLDDDAAEQAILNVGSALSYAHLNGAIHRDVKPQNILLSANGAVKLTDFDLVRSFDTTGGTRQGALGTLIYSAPECLSDASLADERADVYSLAMVALFALRHEKLGLEAMRDTPDLIDGCTAPEATKVALRQATSWNLASRTESVERFCDALRRGRINYADGGRDLPDWLQRLGFTVSCRSQNLSNYANLRARPDWPSIETAVGRCAEATLGELEARFVAGEVPFGARSAVTAFNSTELETSHGFPAGLEKADEKAIKWLVMRRVMLGIARKFRVQLAGERHRLEALLIAFLNIATPDARNNDFLIGEVYKRYITTFRPVMTHHGLVPSRLAMGSEHLPTLGDYEREWLDAAVPEEWPHDLPSWWR